MQVYKILHKPTGLFFTPSRGSGNLSNTGKIYSKKPNLIHIPAEISISISQSTGKLNKKNEIICNHFNLTKKEINSFYHGSYWRKDFIYIKTHKHVPLEDWEIVEF